MSDYLKGLTILFKFILILGVLSTIIRVMFLNGYPGMIEKDLCCISIKALLWNVGYYMKVSEGFSELYVLSLDSWVTAQDANLISAILQYVSFRHRWETLI